MKLKFNRYKINKFKRFIISSHLSFFYHVSSLNSKNWLKIEQILVDEILNFQRLCNIVTKQFIQKSIFKNLTKLINGSVFCTNTQAKKKNFLFFKKLLNINAILILLCIRINNRLYSIFQLNNIKIFNYVINIIELHKILKNVLKILSKKFLLQFSK